MRRFWGIFFDAISTISLVLAIATSILWIRSIRTHDELLYNMIHPETRTFSFYALRSYPGVVGFMIWGIYYADADQFKITNPGDPAYRMSKLPWGWSRDSRPITTAYKWEGSFWNRRGFRIIWARWIASPPPMPRGHSTSYVLTAPHWFLILLFVILPGLRLRRAIRIHRRAKFNLCPSCGYDLRASSGRCPECGLERVESAV